MERKILEASKLDDALAGVSNWKAEGKAIKKEVKFENFASALAYVNRVGELAEAADHHPDITFGWGYAQILLTTHDRGGVTDVDVSLARKIDSL